MSSLLNGPDRPNGPGGTDRPDGPGGPDRPDGPGGYDDASSAHAFLEPCAYCGDLTPGDELIVDQYDYLRCEACCNDICALCQDERVPYANLCEHCLRWQGLAALEGAFAHGLRVQTRGQSDPILGMLRFIVYHGGCAKLIIFTPDGDEDPDGTLSGWTQWVPASEVVRVEECLELSSPNPERLMHYELRQLLDWMVCEITLVKMEDALRQETEASVEADEIMFITPEEGEERELKVTPKSATESALEALIRDTVPEDDGGDESGSDTGATSDVVPDVPHDTQDLLDALGVAEEEADSHSGSLGAETSTSGDVAGDTAGDDHRTGPGARSDAVPGSAGPTAGPGSGPDDKEKDHHRRGGK